MNLKNKSVLSTVNSIDAFYMRRLALVGLWGTIEVNGAIPYAGTKTLYLQIIIKDWALNHLCEHDQLISIFSSMPSLYQENKSYQVSYLNYL